MNIKVKTYKKLTEKEKEQTLRLISSGGEVNNHTLEERFSEVNFVALAYNDDQVIGTAAIKKPLLGYKKGVFKKAYTNLDPDKYTYELGYVFIDESHRGNKLSYKLCKVLLDQVSEENLFATTRTDNAAMDSILKKLHFQESGKPYTGQNGSNKIKLLIKLGTVLSQNAHQNAIK